MYGFKIVNSGGMWEVYQEIKPGVFHKINPVASVLDTLSITRIGPYFSLEITTKEVPYIGYRPATPVDTEITK